MPESNATFPIGSLPHDQRGLFGSERAPVNCKSFCQPIPFSRAKSTHFIDLGTSHHFSTHAKKPAP